MSMFTSNGTENHMRWDRESVGFMEAWYFTANHRRTGAGVWLRYTITSPSPSVGAPYCELWGVVFDPEGKRSFAAKERFGIDRLGSAGGRDDEVVVRIGEAWIAGDHLEGNLADAERSLSWSLDFEPADRCLQHLPPVLRSRIERRVSTVCAPNLQVPMSGSLTLDDETIHFDQEPGYQGHRWGRRHSSTWAWIHCSTFDGGEPALFEGLAARTSIGLIPAPTMTFLYLSFDGQDIAFNDVKTALRARSRYELPTWAFSTSNAHFRVVGAGRASIDRLIQVTYMDPDGSPRYCANSEIADLALEVYRRDGQLWRHAGSLTALRTAHLEFGRREPFVELPVSV